MTFDLRATDGSVRRTPAHLPGEDEPYSERSKANPPPRHKLDSPQMEDKHKKLLDDYLREVERQRDNRIEMANDEDFYDNIQWRVEDAEILKDRGQVPLVYNVISASVDWVTGTEKRARTDFKVLPRRKEDSKPAERKTQLLKYLSDVNRSPFSRSRAFEDAVKVGIGWTEDGLEQDSENEPIFDRYESWRNVLWDSTATNLDLEDARYMCRPKWLDLDVAQAIFPQRHGLLEMSAEDDDAMMALDSFGDEVMDQMEADIVQTHQRFYHDNIFGYYRRRVRLIEMWYRTPMKHDRIRGGTFSGEVYDENSRGHQAEVESGDAEVIQKVGMRMHVAIFTSRGMLWHSESPYRHNRFPFTPIWGYRRGRDGLPYGMIRRIKDIQEDVNKRASKALHILNSNKVVMEEGALGDDMTVEDLVEENARPDGVITVKQGRKIELNADRNLAAGHMDIMARGIQLIQSASGVTDENMGRRTNATSGIAIERRQDQGQLASMKFFDNLLFSSQVKGEKQLSLTEQFMSDEKAFRITNMRGTPEYIKINDDLPENDITRSKADFILDESEFHATMRAAAVTELLNAMRTLPPQVAMVMLDLVIENTDLPNREEIVRRIREVTGMRDPDAEELTEQEVAAQANAEEQAAMAKAMDEAALAKTVAETVKTEAQARQLVAKIVGDNVEAQNKALLAAREAVTMPPAAVDAADIILHESGFESRSDQEQAAAEANAQAELEAQAVAEAEQAAAQQSQFGFDQPEEQTQPLPAA